MPAMKEATDKFHRYLLFSFECSKICRKCKKSKTCIIFKKNNLEEVVKCEIFKKLKKIENL